ncbi:MULTISPECIES: Dyp-type peroxidase [Nocardioides]|uniref:Dyp-type peroxidase n=1 Tax=Nocardioides TaxID=1839 RepID=UPI000565C2A1|nr:MULTISPECIES: Dyp-type peroxidase [Nocardioides]
MSGTHSPQAIVASPAQAALFLVLTVRSGSEEVVRDALAGVPALTRAVGFRAPDDELRCIVGIGAEFWDRLYDRPRPAGLHTFAAIAGAEHTAPSTPGDVLFHIGSQRTDVCFELGYRLIEQLRDHVDVVDEVHGFKFFDERDLLGFVDGTENPVGDEAAGTVLIAEGDHAGGSYVIVQKYLHDLDGWNALTVEQQEAAIGRHKLSDIEIPDDEKASNSHVTLNSITDAAGNDRKIVRENMPFGQIGAAEFGTYFIGYAADPDVTETMLRRMFIGEPAGNHDRVLDFSTPHTGCLFFVPPVGFLEDP